MELKEREGYFFIKDKDLKAGLFFDPQSKLKDEINLAVNAKLPNIRSIATPGEYEMMEMFVMVLQKELQNVYVINLSDVNILMVSPSTSLTEQDLDYIGGTDILILMGEFEITSDVVKFVNRIDPQVLILNKKLYKGEDVHKFFGDITVKYSKKYKFEASDFENEEYKLQIAQITDED